MTESECCELILNAVFYWEPVEFFQKRCDMITLRFFQDEPCGVVLDLLYARDLCYIQPEEMTSDGVGKDVFLL